jgi:plastocyanin
MNKQLAAFVFAGIAALTACGGGGGGGFSPGGGGGGGGNPTPAPSPTGVGAQTIGIALPDGTIGSVNTAPFGVVGGYTQSTYSQVLAFPPGTNITLKNLSSSTTHTLNVLSTTGFPANPALSTSAAGGTSLAAGYQSGNISPGATLSVTLATPGTYYIGCAYHYMDALSMRDVLQVSASATPGPQATPPPAGTGGGGGGCTGIYC